MTWLCAASSTSPAAVIVQRSQESCRRSAQTLLTRPQRILGAVPIVNVSQQHVPASDTALRVSRGKSARLKPAVDAIGTPLAELKNIRLTGFNRAPPCVNHERKVIWMDDAGGSPILQFLGRLAEIFQDLSV